MSNVLQPLYALQTRLWSASDLLGILKAWFSTAVPHSTLRKVAPKNCVCGVTIPPPLPRRPENREAPQGRNQEELQAQCCVLCGSVPALNPWAPLSIKDNDEEPIVNTPRWEARSGCRQGWWNLATIHTHPSTSLYARQKFCDRLLCTGSERTSPDRAGISLC